MSTFEMWSELRKLVRIDHDILQARQKLAALEKENDSVCTKLPQLSHNYHALSDEKSSLNTQLRKVQKRITKLKESDDEKVARLDANVTDPKAISAIQREITAIETELLNLALTLDDLKQKYDTVSAQAKLAETAYYKAMSTSKSTIKENTSESKAIKQSIDECMSRWEAQAARVSDGLLDDYRQIRLRVPNPVVHVIAGGCGACFENLLPHDMDAVNSMAFVRCKGCFRFLFKPEPEESEE